jgi:hypothetical protein
MLSHTIFSRGMRSLAVLSLLFLSVLCIAACQSGGYTDDGIDWINNPGAIKNVLGAVGSCPIANPESVGIARDVAVENARVQLAATLESKVQSMSENWQKIAGIPGTKGMSTYLNKERYTRIFVENATKNARPDRFEQRDGLLYAFVVLENAPQWIKDLGKSITEDAIKDVALFKTEVQKDAARERADAYFKNEAEKVRTLSAKWSRPSKSK